MFCSNNTIQSRGQEPLQNGGCARENTEVGALPVSFFSNKKHLNALLLKMLCLKNTNIFFSS